ncbi:GNAT family N-acetyltransferase [Natronolimnobius sp. AArcel1]|uniref:GNAT family N-acetyltransferase n=1 Tax=Natronolimnobius sp. AArcel1 TaxID=1679093 RepID=UPI0013EBA98D|nr:GNAT family N-acetyltransferase [Natronolimnobius sp. AArcel1]NGM69032.1 GNAT family N-acetyltransferase [Natronolimnobius sp. AArcel1]
MGDNLSVRRFRPADASRVRNLHEAAMRDIGAYLEDVPDDDLENVTETFLERNGEFLVGEVDGQIVAMGGYQLLESDHYITNFLSELPETTIVLTRMRVDPAHQRQGYGSRIYTALEKRARECGYTTIVLDTMASQAAARGLYETNGFEKVCREQLEVSDDSFEMLVYRKQLAE